MTLKPAATTVLTRLRDFCGDRRGVAAVEFAIVVAVHAGALCRRRRTSAMAWRFRSRSRIRAHTLADIATQNKTISNATMQTILNASQQIIAPFSQANAIVTLSEVSTDGSGAATITWSDSLNGTPRPVGQAVTLPASLAGQPNISPDPRRSFLCLYAQSRLRDHRHRLYRGQLFAVSAKLDVYYTLSYLIARRDCGRASTSLRGANATSNPHRHAKHRTWNPGVPDAQLRIRDPHFAPCEKAPTGSGPFVFMIAFRGFWPRNNVRRYSAALSGIAEKSLDFWPSSTSPNPSAAMPKISGVLN